MATLVSHLVIVLVYLLCFLVWMFVARTTDEDRNQIMKERYYLSTSGTKNSDFSNFAVHQDHGWIHLVNKLDFEVSKPVHYLTVVPVLMRYTYL